VEFVVRAGRDVDLLRRIAAHERAALALLGRGRAGVEQRAGGGDERGALEGPLRELHGGLGRELSRTHELSRFRGARSVRGVRESCGGLPDKLSRQSSVVATCFVASGYA